MDSLFIDNIEVPTKDVRMGINLAIADISNPYNSKADYGLNIMLPRTKILDDIFENIWDPNIYLLTFNPNKKLSCQYLSNGTEVFNGDIQAVRCLVNKKTGADYYECRVYGRNANLFFDIGDRYLTGNANPADDIDMSTYDHALSKQNNINTWLPSISPNTNKIAGVDTAVVAGKGYRYPLIQYGKNNNDPSNFYVKDLRPIIFVREILEKIFTLAGWTWNSTFLDSAFFKSLCLYSTEENFTLSSSTINNSQFYAGRVTTDQTINKAFTYNATSAKWVANQAMNNSAFTTYDVIFNDDTTSPFNDAGGQYNTGTGISTIGLTNSYILQTNLKFDLAINPPAGTVTTQVSTGQIVGAVMKYNGTTWNIIGTTSSSFISSTSLTGNSVSVVFNPISIANGDILKVVIYPFNFNVTFLNGLSVPITVGTASLDIKVKPGSEYFAKLLSYNIVENATVSLSQIFPQKIKQKDFVKEIFQMFKLYLEPSKTNANVMNIEDYPNFSNGIKKDWTRKRDISKGEVVIPMGDLGAKTYVLKWKDDADFYNKVYSNTFKESYGQFKLEIDNDFQKGENVYESLFSPTPLVGSDVNGLIIPSMINVSDTGLVSSLKCNMRIGLWNGNKTMNFGTWNLKSVSGDSNYNSFPSSGHLDDVYNPTFDLNFDNPRKVFWNPPVLNYTDNNIGNKYHLPYLNQITDKRSLVVKRWYDLTDIDINEFSFMDTILDENQYYRVNNIKDFDPKDPNTTEVELLKLIDYSAYIPTTIGLNNQDAETPNLSARSINTRSVAEQASTDAQGNYRYAGGLKPTAKTYTTDFENDADTKRYFGDMSSNDIYVTLIDYGIEVTITALDTMGAGTRVIITPAEGQIDFAANYTLASQGASITVEFIDGNWYAKCKI